ncbi:hypothetical protein D3C80_1912400 [compost metagenome]
MPPRAAKPGRARWLQVDNWPASISRLISRPTSMKKIAIRPSLIQCSIDSPASLTCRVAKYTSAHGELATISAASAAAMRITPPADSAAKKRVRKARVEGD